MRRINIAPANYSVVEEELILVVSRDSKEAKSICKQISDKLRKKGLDSSGPLCLPKVHITEAKRVVLDGGRTAEESHNWLEQVRRATIENLGHAKSQMVNGYSFKFQCRVDIDVEHILGFVDDVSVATVIQTTRVKNSVSNSSDSPFSYDPAQDFVTEL